MPRIAREQPRRLAVQNGFRHERPEALQEAACE
jgi:hypothetical protein